MSDSTQPKKAHGKESVNLASVDKNLRYTIDAVGKRLGRVASQAAKALMGKTRVDYTPNIATPIKVVIMNAGGLDITEKKRQQRVYKRYTGYPGGQRIEKLGDLMGRRGIDVALRKTIERMLPKNTLRKIRMNNLEIFNDENK